MKLQILPALDVPFIGTSVSSEYWPVVEILHVRTKGPYTFTTALHNMSKFDPTSKPLEMTTVRNSKGHYVGDPRFANILIKRGIVAELADDTHNVCSIGFCEAENKWYGWSHRAMFGFGLGDKLFIERFGTDTTSFNKHGPTPIATLEQARQSAINFAGYVS